MAKNPPGNTTKSQPDDPAQFQRFLDLAKEIGADADERGLEASVKRLAAQPPEPRRKFGKKAKPKKRS
jgi:hypothetical protein